MIEVVADRNREHLLRLTLLDDEAIEVIADFAGFEIELPDQPQGDFRALYFFRRQRLQGRRLIRRLAVTRRPP